jgi:hypothetical protein
MSFDLSQIAADLLETSTSPELTNRPEGTKIEDAQFVLALPPPPLPETVVKAPAEATSVSVVAFAEELGAEINTRVDTAQKELGPIGFGILFLILMLRAIF